MQLDKPDIIILTRIYILGKYCISYWFPTWANNQTSNLSNNLQKVWIFAKDRPFCFWLEGRHSPSILLWSMGYCSQSSSTWSSNGTSRNQQWNVVFLFIHFSFTPGSLSCCPLLACGLSGGNLIIYQASRSIRGCKNPFWLGPTAEIRGALIKATGKLQKTGSGKLVGSASGFLHYGHGLMETFEN